MKPAPFAYARAQSVPHAVDLLAKADGEGKIIAGGQSLMPMINFRLVKPAVLVDINRIPGLDTIEDLGGRLRIGALVRHRMTASDSVIAARIPVMHEAMQHVAHWTVRNRGTFCGSVCHADPAAEMPMMALLLDATVIVAGPNGERRVAAKDFIVSSLTTDLAADELAVGIEVDTLSPETGWGFAEFARRHGDYALACVAATMDRADGAARNVRVSVMGVGETALRLPAVEAALEGSDGSPDAIAAAVERLQADITPSNDLSGSADYRRHLAGHLATKVLTQAWDRAKEKVSA